MAYVKISDPYKRNKIVNDYLATRKALYNESLAEQLGNITKEEHLATMFKPVTSAISKANNAAIETAVRVSNLPALPAALNVLQAIEGPPNDSEVSVSDVDEPPTFAQAMPTTSTASERSVSSMTTMKFGPIASEYLMKTGNKYDSVDRIYGIRTVGDKWYIGNKPVTFSGDDFTVAGTTYKGTRGLWELIMSDYPKNEIYDDSDMKNYEKILYHTDALRRNYKHDETHPIQSKGYKWTHILKPIWEQYTKGKMPPPKTVATKEISGTGALPAAWPNRPGGGVAVVQPERSVGVVHLSSDPNALIERLDLLFSSKAAGNTGVLNEITAIIDELLRMNVIDINLYKELTHI